MKFIQIFISILFTTIFAQEETEKFDCSDFKQLFIGNLLTYFSQDKVKDKHKTNFFLATTHRPKLVQIGHDDWDGLFTSAFNSSARTYFIVHGYKTHYKKPWLLTLKSKLLELENVNIIIVDWYKNGFYLNYVNSVKSTLFVRKHIYNFLQEMKTAVANSGIPITDVLWNNLYFIGHSLGAHLSAQVAHLLKNDNFFKVERITGLDPAQPCFTVSPLSLKIDKDDADFVDIIHTQTGTTGKLDGLGIKEPSGHVDFYVNGGVTQPACENKTMEMRVFLCSHKMAPKYFIESVINSRNDECKFSAYDWDRTHEGALEAVDKKVNGINCNDCPEMGFNASKNKAKGNFIVITGAQLPYCEFTTSDASKVRTSIEGLEKPRKTILAATNADVGSIWRKIFRF